MVEAPDAIRLGWAQAWQLSLLIMAVAAAVRVTSRNRPYLAHALWLVVLIKCITPPLWSSPGGIFCWLESRVAAATRVEARGVSPKNSDREVDGSRGRLAAMPSDVVVWRADGGERANRGGATAVATLAVSTQTGPSCEVWILLVWLAGTGLVLAVACWRWWRCLLQLYRHRVPHDAAYDAALTGLAQRLKLRRPVRLLITSSRFGPAVIGLRRPVIALPEIIVQGKSPEDLEPILAHELIHVRRGDLWVGLLQTLAMGLWWFHPLVWRANRWLSREAERCCDEAVLATLGCAPARYARCLLDVLERKQTLRPVPAFPGVRPVEVTNHRLERIMQLRQGCRQRTPWWCWLVMFAVAAATLPGAAWVSRAEDPAELAPREWQLHPVFPRPLPPSPRQAKPAMAVPLGPLATRHYDLEGVLARAREELDCRWNEARTQVANEMAAAGGSEWAKLSVDAVPDETGGATIQDDERRPPQPELHWRGTTAIVRHDESGHQRIAERIAELRRYGFAQLLVEMQFIKARSEVVEKAVAAWQLSAVETPEAADVFAAPAKRDSWDPGAAGTKQRLGNQSISSIEQRCPFQYQVVDDDQFRRIDAVLKKDTKTQVLSAPRIVTFNGRTAMVQSGCQRPFVVGLRGGEPQIQIVTEGMTLRLQPELLRVRPPNEQDREVAAVAHSAEIPQAKLALQFVHSEILDVTTRTIRVAGRTEPVTLQVPRVQSTTVESTLVAPLDQTLIIGGLQTQDDKVGTQSLLVMVKVRRHQPDSPARTFGVGVNSEAGVTGQMTVDEASFASLVGAYGDQPRSADRAVENASVRVRVYPVADLVVPTPASVVVLRDGKHGAWSSQRTQEPFKPAAADFDKLIDLIRSTVFPESWASAGGPGEIEYFPTNLSLVVSQTPAIHVQIGELLQTLRRSQAVQVVLETRVLGLSDADYHEIETDDGANVASRGYGLLTDERMRALMRSVQDRDSNDMLFAPKFTLFQGQAVTLELGDSQSPYTLILKPEACDDRSAVRLQYAVSTAGQPELREDQPPLTIANGHTLFIDTDGHLRPESFGRKKEAEVPMLKKVPYVNRLFKNPPSLETNRVAVLVTPRIIVNEEEEILALPRPAK